MDTAHGFVDPMSIPTPGGSPMPLRAIEAAHDLSRHAYRDISASAHRARGDMQAAADVMTNGAIEVPRFETEIVDWVRRRGYLGQRVRRVPAVSDPGHYFEQNAIIPGTFVDPRILAVTAGFAKRSERYLKMRAIAAQSNYGLFDTELTRQQNIWPALLAKDLEDMITGIMRTSDRAIWRGAAASEIDPASFEYCGGLTQINRTASVASTASAIDAIKREAASMAGNQDFEARPSALYCQAEGQAILEEEERLNHRQMANAVVAGVTVSGIATSTPAGIIPCLTDSALGAPVASATEPGKTDYTFVLLTEEMVEMQWIGSPDPRLFLLGLTNTLASQYVAVLFDAVVFKGKAATSVPEIGALTYAHSVMTVTR